MCKRIFAVLAFLITLMMICQARAGGAGEAMKLSVESPAFGQGEKIPVKYTCDGEDMSPPLKWSPGPAATKSYALIVDDPDAPGGSFTHWLAYNVPSGVTSLDEHVTALYRLGDGTLQGKNSYGRIGYGGPCPPPGRPHHYRFGVYALDTRLKLGPGASKDGLLTAMSGHVLAQGELTGVYGRY
jgi:Raf kinase inhibitor-like YbhB/YbcL family protein